MPPRRGTEARVKPAARVEVHIVRLDRIAEPDAARLMALCSRAERARAARLRRGDARRRSLLTRGVARTLLALRLDTEPERIPLHADAAGKPRLTARGDLRLSIAHAGGVAAIAFVAGREVGVDVEVRDPELDVDAIVRRFFPRHEAAQLFALPTPERRVAFFRSWTRKEALAKAYGTGLSRPFRELRIPAPDAPAPAPVSTPGDRRWAIADIGVPDGYAGAVAAAGDRWWPVLSAWSDVSAERFSPP